MRVVWCAFWCALTGLVGCGSSESGGEDLDGSNGTADRQLFIGEGDALTNAFTAIQDGDPLPLIGGPQGGYHVFLQMRVTGVKPDVGNLTTKLVQPDAALILREQHNSIALIPPEEGAQDLGIASGLQVFVCPALIPGYAMQDTQLRVTLELLTGGVDIESSVLISPQCPAGDPVCTDSDQIGCAPTED